MDKVKSASGVLVRVVLPSALAVALLVIFNFFAYQRELSFFHNVEENSIAGTRSTIQRRFQSAMIAVESVRAFFAGSTDVTREEFDLFGSVLTKNVSAGAIAMPITVEWVDADNKITYVYPMSAENAKIVDADLNKNPNRLLSIEKAKATRSPTVTEPIMLGQGYPGIILYSPIFKGDKYMGEAVVVMRLKSLLSPVSGSGVTFDKNEHVRVGDFILPFNEDVILTSAGERVVTPPGSTMKDALSEKYTNATENTLTQEVVLADKVWQLRFPSTDVAAARREMVPFVALSAFFAVMLVIFLCVLERRRRRFAEELATTEALIGSIGDGLVVCDKGGVITFMNAIAEDLSGYSAKESIGKSYYDVWRLFDKDGVAVPEKERFLYRAMTKKELVTVPMRSHYSLLKKDGTYLPIASFVAPVLVDREVKGAMVSFRDVTSESEMDKMKSEFISLASHQLKTPLTAISWNLEVLLAGEKGSLTPEQLEAVKDMYASTKNMSELIGGFLEITKMEAGDFKVEKGDVDLVQIADSLLEELEKPITDKKIEVVRKYGAPTLHSDIGTKTARIILQNLLTNAVKYTENGTVEVGMKKTAEGIDLYVKDTGFGIADADKSRIFTKLFRADNARKKEPSGTGLGLYILKELVDKLGGKAWFESREGVGSTFHVHLP